MIYTRTGTSVVSVNLLHLKKKKKTQNMMASPASAPLPDQDKHQRFKVHSQSSSSADSRLSPCVFSALCLHSLLLSVQMQTKHFPPVCALPSELSKSVSGAYLGFNVRTGHLSGFHSSSFSERLAEIFW